MMRLLISLFLVLLATGCGQGDPAFVRLGDYECDAGEAAIRHLLKTMPDPAPGLPKDYCVLKALDQRATDMDFLPRFKDLNLNFISAEVLSEQPETHYPLNPKSGLSPVLLQLQMMTRPAPDRYEIDANWAFKKTFERWKLSVQQKDGKWTVADAKMVEGNAR